MRSIGRSVRSVRSVCLKIFVLFELFVFKKNLVFKMMSVQNDEWFKMMSGSFVVSGFM